MKKYIILSVAIILILLSAALTTGCREQTVPPEPSPPPTPAPAPSPTPSPAPTPTPTPTPPPAPERIVSERLVDQIDLSAWIAESFTASANGKRVAYVAEDGSERFVVVDGNEGYHYDDITIGSLTFSPDSQRLAYAAQRDDKWFVVVDGKEEREYDSLMKDSITFSPDSQRIVHGA